MTEHDWELKGGSVVQNGQPSIPLGVALFQCRRCNVAASRALTARNESVNAIVPVPEIDVPCDGRDA